MTTLLEDLNERLLTHFVGGAWRAPLATRLVPLRTPRGVVGQVVLAGPSDFARAQSLQCVGAAHDWDRLTSVAKAEAASLAAELERFGFASDPKDLCNIPCAMREVTPDWNPNPLTLLHTLALARIAQRIQLRPGLLAVLPAALR